LLPSSEVIAKRYATVSGRPLRSWSFYLALAYFKLAIIAAGIDFRRRTGGLVVPCDGPGDAVAPLLAAGIHSIAGGRD
jgi:hypothetical protein